MNPNQQVNDLINAMNRLVNSQSNAAAQAQKQADKKWLQEKKLIIETDNYIDSITKGRKLNAEQLELEQKVRAAKKKELDLLKEIQRVEKVKLELEKKGFHGNKEHQEAQEVITGLQKKHGKATLETSKLGEKLISSFRGLFKGINVAGIALTFFGAAIKNSINLARDQMVANQGLIEGTTYLSGMMTQQGQAFKRGIDPVEFAKMTTANRQMINAMGGTANALEVLEPSVLDLYTMTGSQAEAYKQLLEAATQFTQKGIRPTQSAIIAYTGDVKELAKRTGMSSEAAASFYNEVSNDVDSIILLRAAREDEREAILKNQRAMLLSAQAAGMTAEQAKEAAKMLNKMVAAKPLDRIKQAAKIRAMGGALGIAGSNEAADDLMHGKVNSKAMMAFSQAAANKVDDSRKQGLPTEILTSSLVDKMDLGSQFGPGSPFSTTLGTSLKPVEGMLEKYSAASNSLVGVGLQKMDVAIEWLKQIANGTIIMNAVVSGFESIYKFFSGESASNWIYETMSSMTKTMDVIGGGIEVVVGSINAVVGVMSAISGAIIKFLTLGVFGDTLLGMAKGMFDTSREHFSNVGKAIDFNNSDMSSRGGSKPGNIATPRSPTSPTAKVDQAAANTDTQKVQKDEKVSQAAQDTASSSQDTATGIQAQLKKMDDNAVMMQKLVANSDKAVDLAEKQLIALTMTEKERTEGEIRSNLRRDNRFGAQYSYL